MTAKMRNLSADVGLEVAKAFFKDSSLLGPMRVMFERAGRFFQIPLPFFHPYVVVGAQAARNVLVTQRDKLRWRNADPVTDLLRQGVLVTDGDEHDYYRKLMEPSLAAGMLLSYADMMQRQTLRVMSTWQDGQVVDMLVEGRKIALLIVMDALFGVDVWDDLPRIWMPILKLIEYISPGPWILWRKIPRPGYKKHVQALDDYLYGIIRAKRLDNGGQHNLLQHLIAAGLDDERIRDQMLTMLIAGHDTSTALLAWVFVLLGQNPAVYSQLVAALDVSEPGTYPHLLEEVIKESLRLYPPIHIGNRVAAEEINFEEGVVPAGERMFYSIYLTHRDPQNWERPDEFCPERFAQGHKQPSFSYIPFGGGPRACMGAAFGQAEARIVIACLLQKFRFQALATSKIRVHMGATLEPRPGVLMRVALRQTLSKP